MSVALPDGEAPSFPGRGRDALQEKVGLDGGGRPAGGSSVRVRANAYVHAFETEATGQGEPGGSECVRNR